MSLSDSQDCLEEDFKCSHVNCNFKFITKYIGCSRKHSIIFHYPECFGLCNSDLEKETEQTAAESFH